MKLLTIARGLKRRKARERGSAFVAEGVRTVEVVLASGNPVRGLLVSSAASGEVRVAPMFAAAAARGIPVQIVTDVEFASAADTDTPQGVLAVADQPPYSLADVPSAEDLGGTVLLLDGLQDPGNVGTILRTAAALGVSATLALPGTVDLWNAKVVRGAMGIHCSHVALSVTWEEAEAFLKERKRPLWVAAADGDPLDRVAARRAANETRQPIALAVGNEGAGVSPTVTAAAAHRVAIAMTSGVESLNVAVATGILLHALRSS